MPASFIPAKKARSGPCDDAYLLAHPPTRDDNHSVASMHRRLKNTKSGKLFAHLTEEQQRIAHEELARYMAKPRNAERLRDPKQRRWLYPALVGQASKYAQYGPQWNNCKGRTLRRLRYYKIDRYLALKAREEGLDVPLPTPPWAQLHKKKAAAPAKPKARSALLPLS